MISYIKGKLVEKTPTRVIIETLGGVAYELHISLHTYSQIQAVTNGQLLIYYYIKDNLHSLYGFADTTEKELFVRLISVSGIGPSTAQMMLSALPPKEVKAAIVSENVNLIKTIKGIGAKTAQRLILELKDKLAKEENLLPTMVSHNSHREEALTALLALGIPKPNAQKALNRVLKSGAAINSVEALIKAALKVL